MENGNRKRIVAVDDSPIILKRLTELLGENTILSPLPRGCGPCSIFGRNRKGRP